MVFILVDDSHHFHGSLLQRGLRGPDDLLLLCIRVSGQSSATTLRSQRNRWALNAYLILF